MAAQPALPDELLHALLDRMAVARLGLSTADGRPEVLPIVCARVGQTLFSPVDGKPKAHARLARLAHLEREPRVALVFDHYDADWRQLWWIKLEADAVIARGAHAAWEAAVAALRAKYPQYATTPLFLGEPTLVVLPWQRVRWWAAGGLGGLEAWLADAD
ncbi:MAG: pyridoxamine 5'-phosphate oxidase family protein [Gammaproteobacteria bacterium]|nr:pyridoxamine 5'-phosphate oxidase family protein [Gammaproteobacteria bacterium]